MQTTDPSERTFRMPQASALPRVLVVEDDPDFAELVRMELEEGGYVVDVTSSVDAARRRMRDDDAPDLVLSDVRLPGDSGINLLFGEEGARRPPVILMSAFPSRDLREFADENDTTLLEKPFSFAHLHESVGRVLVHGRASGSVKRGVS